MAVLPDMREFCPRKLHLPVLLPLLELCAVVGPPQCEVAVATLPRSLLLLLEPCVPPQFEAFST